LAQWVAAIPSIRYSAAIVTPWTHRDAVTVPATPTSHFDRASFTTFGEHPPLVARGPHGYVYVLESVPAEHAVTLHAGSEPDESAFSAVVGEAGETPGVLATLPAAPRTAEGLGLGSLRSAVERVLGPARAQRTSCGTDVVRYIPRNPVMSESEMWFVYRNGRVVAFARYEAV
jgi:hypothetical protein